MNGKFSILVHRLILPKELENRMTLNTCFGDHRTLCQQAIFNRTAHFREHPLPQTLVGLKAIVTTAIVKTGYMHLL